MYIEFELIHYGNIHFLLHWRDVGRVAEGMLFVRMLIYVSGQTYDILQRSYDEPT